MLMSGADYRESLRAYKPRVFVNGNAVDSVADEPLLAPGVAGVGVTYDFALKQEHVPIMTARQSTSGKIVNRMLHIDETSQDLLFKLEAIRLVCKTFGCAQRYLAHDAFNGLYQSTMLTDSRHGTDYSQRFLAYLHDAQEKDLTLGIAMTDAKGDRSKRPGKQVNRDVYVHIKERRPDGIVIRGTKAIVTGAPYMHEFLVMPCRTHSPEDSDFAVCCAVPCDAPGVTIIARPAGRPGEAAAKFSGKYGQSVGVVTFDDVFVPHGRVFLAGETEEGGHHHQWRHAAPRAVPPGRGSACRAARHPTSNPAAASTARPCADRTRSTNARAAVGLGASGNATIGSWVTAAEDCGKSIPRTAVPPAMTSVR